MLKFVTILTITLFSEGGKDYGVQVPFPDEMSCGAAIPSAFDAFDDQFPDVMVQCLRTGIISQSPRPKPKPDFLKEVSHDAGI